MNSKKIYLVGIKGVGMTTLAIYLKEQGHVVWGSDVAEVFPTDLVLSENNIDVVDGFKKENITGDVDLVVTTGAHGGLKNIEVKAARELKIPVMSLAEFVGQETKKFQKVISVCGTHGKTTTSAMLAYVLHQMGLSASHLVGAAYFSGLLGGHFGEYDYLVVEADEYVASLGIDDTPRFMHQEPDVIICTNIDHDHVDVYPTIENVEAVFTGFFKKLDKKEGVLIYCANDKRLRTLVSHLELKHIVSYNFDSSSNLKLTIAGEHNLLNASGVLVCTDILNLDRNLAKKYLASYFGSSRRFEMIFENNSTFLYDDYAHHPREIEATILAARGKYPSHRIFVIFQPHTFSRTKVFLGEFAKALSKADKVLVVDIFGSAREKKGSITSENLQQEAEKMKIANVRYVSFLEVQEALSTEIKNGDIIITMGAGDIYKTHADIITLIKQL